MPKLSNEAEDLLESLWAKLGEGAQSDLDLAEVHDLENSQALPELLHRGLATAERDGLVLTMQGRQECISAVRRHRLAERLLADVLDVEGLAMDETACGFEHSLTRGIEAAICTLLGHPRVCPHGKAIPEGECCRQQRQVVPRAIAPLSDITQDHGGRIAYIHTEDARKLQKMMAMGVLPGKEITLLQRFPSYVFRVGNSQFAVDEEIARSIYVRLRQRSEQS